MRHRVYGKKLGLNKDQRTALFKSLVQALFISESIETTEAKAKAVKGLVDKLINQAKSPATRRLVHQFIVSKSLSEKLIKDIAPRFKDRNSGYTTLVKVGKRIGDSANIVRMSLIEGPVEEIPSSKKQVLNRKKEVKTAKPKIVKSARKAK